jgi:catalase (peroxidase I)
MRTSFRAPQARNLLVSTATIGTAYYVYQQNKRLDLIPLMNLGVQAQCASVAYQKPSQDRVDQCHKDMMDFIGKRRNMAPLMIRLSWHDAGTYDAKDGSGGPRACMRFDGGEAAHGANAGLQIARDLVAPLKEKYQDFSNADFWSLAAICAIKVMGGPDISWRAGRPDSASGKDSVPDGRLPDATQGCPHLRSVFHRMGFSDQEIVALSGAHAVGMCHGDRSGFIGPWTTTALDFDNAFFVNLTQMKWHKTKQANGLEVYVTEDQPGIIMLPTDMALMTDEKMVCWVELYAKDKQRWFNDFSSAFAKL